MRRNSSAREKILSAARALVELRGYSALGELYNSTDRLSGLSASALALLGARAPREAAAGT